MASALDVCLDDRIKSNKKSLGGSFRGGRGGGGSGPGPARRPPNRAGNRAVPYSVGKIFEQQVQAPDSAWQHDMYSDQMADYPGPGLARPSAIETGTKLYIFNLDYGVSDEDIKELFSEVVILNVPQLTMIGAEDRRGQLKWYSQGGLML